MGIGQDAGGDGKVYVSSGGTLLADQQLHLGEGYLGASTGRLSVSGTGSSVHVGQELLVGQWGTGELTVGDGATVSSAGHFSVGTQAGSSGSVLVDGVGSKVSTEAHGIVGDAGTGYMVVQNGGSFHAAGWSALGVVNAGTLDVHTGGDVTFDNDLSLGVLASGQGTLTVNGVGSSAAIGGALTVGQYGTGAMNLANRATVNVAGSAMLVGGNPDGAGTVSVDGAGTTLISNQMLVGWQGTGHLDISNGGEAHSNNQLTIGWQGTGSVSVDGAGSKLSAIGYTSLGDMGAASMTLAHGADFTAGDIVVLGLNSSGNASLAINSGSTVSVAKDVQVGWQGTGTLSVDGLGSTLQVVNGGLFAGWKGTGTINVTNGGTINTNGWAAVGDQAGSHGAMTVDGPGSQFNLTGGMTVGNQGTGTLDITHGGTVNTTGWGTQVGGAAGSSGTVTVDGTGSTWTNSGDLLVGWAGTGSLAVSNGGALSTHVLTVGGDFSSGVGQGTLAISNGGTVNSFDGLIGNSSGSTGKATVDGAGSVWNISTDLEVGLSGAGSSGTLDIKNGGAVTVGSSLGIGLNGSTGAVTVDSAGSLSVVGGIALGYASTGPGTLAITNGGSVSTSYGAIAATAGSVGSLTVDGLGSTWTTSDHLNVGESGTGSLVITHGGAVSSVSVTVAANGGSTGTVTVDGGTLNTSSLTINTGGTVNFNSTSLTAGAINSSTLTNAGQFTINTRDPIAGSADVRTLGATVSNLATGRVDVNLANDASVTFTGPVTNDGLFKVTQLTGTSGGVTSFTGTFTNNGTFISDPTTTHFTDLFNFGQFTAGPGDTIIVDHGFVNNGTVDIFGGAEFYGDYSGPGTLQFHISSASDRLFFNSGFTGSLELIFDPGYLLTGTENFLYFGQGAYLTDLLIGGVDHGSAGYTGGGYLSGGGTFIPASSVPDTAGTLGLLGGALLALAAIRRRVA